MLLKNGTANIEHRNLSDYTPLSLAASGGYVDIIKMLLKHGAEINSRTNSKLGISPLMLASMNGHEEATRVLLENGAYFWNLLRLDIHKINFYISQVRI